MSLVIGMSYRDEFVIVANDSKVTIQMYDLKTSEPSFNEIIETDLTSEKVHLITSKVLLSTTGDMATADLIGKELYKRVNSENDLEECADILQTLIRDLKEGLVKDLSKEETDAVWFLKSISGFTCNLFGFFHNGISGSVDFQISDSDVTFEMLESSMVKGYPIIIQSPDPERDRENFNKYLSLPYEEQTLDNFVNRFVTIHAHLSSIHKGVSTDCKFHILYKDGNDGNKIKYHKQTVETEDFYNELGLNKK